LQNAAIVERLHYLGYVFAKDDLPILQQHAVPECVVQVPDDALDPFLFRSRFVHVLDDG
jgi:hypothetical protein